MAPSPALIISIAALGAVIFQSVLTWNPSTKTLSFKSNEDLGSHTGAGAGAASSAVASVLVPHDSRDALPSGWTDVGAPAGSTSMSMRIALPSKDAPGLRKVLMDVSTPGNPKYGQHLSNAQVKTYMAPDPASVQAVSSWLASEGITPQIHAGHGDWLGFNASVADASRLFNASFSTYRHKDSGHEAIRTMSYSIPASIQQHVQTVYPMTNFVPPKQKKTASSYTQARSKRRAPSRRGFFGIDASCSTAITPRCLQQIYDILSSPARLGGNAITVTGYGGQFVQDADVQSFLTQFRPDINSSTTFQVELLDGGLNTQNASEAGLEANLDIEYTIGVATGVDVKFLSVGDGSLNGFLDTTNFLLTVDETSTVLSTSYDFPESAAAPAFLEKLCDAYASLGVRGVSVIFAAGDGGVGGGRGGGAQNECTVFVPTFPATCPFVTAMGATQGVPEIAASLSSGGFSNVFSIPDYQASQVQLYLDDLGSTNAGLFNASGRGFPDVSAYGQDMSMVTGGANILEAGTSFATPIFASVVALLNDQRLSSNQPPLGFLNPWLYANGSVALTDITEGSNPGCNTQGFPAMIGWDPVTGLGSPKFAELADAVGLL